MRITIASVVALLASALPTVALAQAGPPQVTFLTSGETTKLNLPFSEAVRVGNVLYLSGNVGNKPGTNQLVPGGTEGQTRQALENIKTVLERYGSSMDRVFKCTVMMADISEWGKMNAVYVTFFKQHFPARSAIGASGLALGAAVEIECLATVGP